MAGYPGQSESLPSRWPFAAALGRWLGFGAWTATVAAALSAVQLLPSLEAASRATRGVVRMSDGSILLDVVLPILGLFGPSPTGLKPALGWEYRGGLGVLWVTAALLAPALCGGRV